MKRVILTACGFAMIIFAANGAADITAYWLGYPWVGIVGFT